MKLANGSHNSWHNNLERWRPWRKSSESENYIREFLESWLPVDWRFFSSRTAPYINPTRILVVSKNSIENKSARFTNGLEARLPFKFTECHVIG